MQVPDIICCVDCGQSAHRMTEAPEAGWETGDIVAYRCRGCNDRWDIVIDDPAEHHPRWDGLDGFDFRQFLQERGSQQKD